MSVVWRPSAMPAGSPLTDFVGRELELGFLDEHFGAVRSGQPRSVLIEGPSGIGKTALVRRFISGLDPAVRVLDASGEELEREMPYGVLQQLVAAAGSPDTVGIGTRGQTAPDPLAAGIEFMGLLARLERDQPLVLVIDDAQWADRSSLGALVVALRRQTPAHLLTLLVVRQDDGEAASLPPSVYRLVESSHGSRLTLGGLEAFELRRLAASLRVDGLSPRMAARLWDHTEGNPLYARAVLEEMPAEAFIDPTVPLPCPLSFALMVLGRLAACAADGQRLVVASSVLGTPCDLSVAARLAEVDDPLIAVEHAMAAHLLEARNTINGWTIDFPHTLVRAAVYHNLGPAHRSSLHTAAAGLVEDHEASLRHRVTAVGGKDPALAEEVSSFGLRKATEGRPAAAARYLLAAARLVPDGPRHEDFLLASVEYLLLAGETSEAATFASHIAGFADSARRQYELGRLALVSGRPEAEKLLNDAWGRSDPGDPFRGQLAELLAWVRLLQGDGQEATVWGVRALLGAQRDPYGIAPLLIGLGMSGRLPEAVNSASLLPQSTSDLSPEGLAGVFARGVLRSWSDDLVAAHQDLTVALSAPSRAIAYDRLVLVQCLSEVEYRLGAWDDAIAHAELAISIAQDTGQRSLLARPHVLAMCPLAMRGDWDRADAHIREAASVAGDDDSVVWVAFARAFLAGARGDAEGVVSSMLSVLDPAQLANVGVLLAVRWGCLFADALVSLGRLDQAAAVLDSLVDPTDSGSRRTVTMHAAPVRGRLEAARDRPVEAEAAFAAGLAVAEEMACAFDRAQIEAAFGGFLRRRGQRHAAVERLEAARRAFTVLGARPFVERCDDELVACTLHRPRRDGADRTRLTRRELAVAQLVATGLTNREVAEQLFLSVKTVEFHLANVFAKLGVTARRDLAARVPVTVSSTAS